MRGGDGVPWPAAGTCRRRFFRIFLFCDFLLVAPHYPVAGGAAPISLAVFAAFFAAAFSSLLADDASTRFACSASLLARFSPTRNSEHCPGTRPSSAHNVASPACRRFQLRLASLRLGLGLLERRL